MSGVVAQCSTKDPSPWVCFQVVACCPTVRPASPPFSPIRVQSSCASRPILRSCSSKFHRKSIALTAILCLAAKLAHTPLASSSASRSPLRRAYSTGVDICIFLVCVLFAPLSPLTLGDQASILCQCQTVAEVTGQGWSHHNLRTSVARLLTVEQLQGNQHEASKVERICEGLLSRSITHSHSLCDISRLSHRDGFGSGIPSMSRLGSQPPTPVGLALACATTR